MNEQAKKTAKPRTTRKSAKQKSVADSIKTVKAQVNNKFDDDDMIPCMSVTAGILTYNGRRTRDNYIFNSFGDVIPIYYKDIKAEMMNTRSEYIYEPLFLILDEEVYDQFDKIKNLYETTLGSEAVELLLTKGEPNEIKELCSSMSDNRKEILGHLITDYISDGTITDYRRINLLSDVFGIDFNMAQQR